MPLTERDKAVLEFERGWWAAPGTKEAAIRERFQLSGSRYYEILGALVETSEAMTQDPLLVRRLRRMRDRRRKERFEGRPAGQWRSR